MPRAISPQLRSKLSAADAAHIADGIGHTVRARVSLDLLERARGLTGLRDTEQVLHAALVALVADEESPKAAVEGVSPRFERPYKRSL